MENNTISVISIDEIKGGEILAKDIYLPNGAILMSEGAVLRTAYIERLKAMGFTKLSIVTHEITSLLDETTEKQIQNQCRESVRTTIDRYSYGLDAELVDIAIVADNIMKEVLAQPEVLYNVYKIRDKSEGSYLHSINVSALSVLVGVKMRMQEHRLKNMAVGALLHDIGLVYVPFDLTKVDIDQCDENSLKEIRKHVIYGYSAVEKETWLSNTAKDIIINHHERLDGTGYPFHLTAEKISLEAKIVALCDEFDNMVYGNYMKKHKVHETMDYLVSQAGIKFDFKVTQAFLASVAAYPIGTVVSTNEGETGVVVRQNQNIPTRPVIRILTADSNGKYQPGMEKNLTVELTTFITDTIG